MRQRHWALLIVAATVIVGCILDVWMLVFTLTTVVVGCVICVWVFLRKHEFHSWDSIKSWYRLHRLLRRARMIHDDAVFDHIITDVWVFKPTAARLEKMAQRAASLYSSPFVDFSLDIRRKRIARFCYFRSLRKWIQLRRQLALAHELVEKMEKDAPHGTIGHYLLDLDDIMKRVRHLNDSYLMEISTKPYQEKLHELAVLGSEVHMRHLRDQIVSDFDRIFKTACDISQHAEYGPTHPPEFWEELWEAHPHEWQWTNLIGSVKHFSWKGL